jgi:hypothetical protein
MEPKHSPSMVAGKDTTGQRPVDRAKGSLSIDLRVRPRVGYAERGWPKGAKAMRALRYTKSWLRTPVHSAAVSGMAPDCGNSSLRAE